MILDQLIKLGTMGLGDKAVPALCELVDLTLETNEAGKIVSQKIKDVKIPLSSLIVRYSPDEANDTMKWTKDGIKNGRASKPFMGIPVKNGRTQVKTLIKAVWVLHQNADLQNLLRELESEDVDVRFQNSSKIAWKNASTGTKDPDSEFKSSGVSICSVGRTSRGFIVLGLVAPSGVSDIDDDASVALTLGLLNPDAAPKAAALPKVSDTLHVAKGQGRLNFGKEPKDTDAPCEYARVFGIDTPQDLEVLQRQHAATLKYRIRVSPSPEKSYLAIFPRSEEDIGVVKELVELLSLRPDKTKTEDGIELKSKRKAILPQLHELENPDISIVMVTPEDGQKTKLVSRAMFPRVPILYWYFLELIFADFHPQENITSFERVIINGPKGAASPAAYLLWTRILTRLLGVKKISVRPIWQRLNAYYKTWPDAYIWGNDTPKGAKKYELHRGREWMKMVKIFNRLNAIVELEQEKKLPALDINDIYDYLRMKETTTTKDEALSLCAERLPGLWDTLHPNLQDRLAEAVVASEVPEVSDKDRRLFTQGMALGACLQYAGYVLQTKAKRSFTPGRGRHLTQLRGDALLGELRHAFTLGESYNQGKTPDKRVSPLPRGSMVYFERYLVDSKTNAFNNGLICGFDLPAKTKEANLEDVNLESEV